MLEEIIATFRNMRAGERDRLRLRLRLKVKGFTGPISERRVSLRPWRA